MDVDTITPLAADLARLPSSLIESIVALHDEAILFARTADPGEQDAIRGAYGLITFLAPIAGLTKRQAANAADVSPATFSRWARISETRKPHRAQAIGLLGGVGRVARAGRRDLIEHVRGDFNKLEATRIGVNLARRDQKDIEYFPMDSADS